MRQDLDPEYEVIVDHMLSFEGDAPKGWEIAEVRDFSPRKLDHHSKGIHTDYGWILKLKGVFFEGVEMDVTITERDCPHINVGRGSNPVIIADGEMVQWIILERFTLAQWQAIQIGIL